MNNDFGIRTINESEFNKVFNFINYKKQRNYDFKYLLDELEKRGDIILIGGAIRDIILKNSEPRDIDIIIDTNDELRFLEKSFKKVDRNRFGGYKIHLNEIVVDVWSIQNHWAFREKILEKSFINIKYSTLLNYDSILLNLTKNIGCVEIFNEMAKSFYLDFTLSERDVNKNPTKAINIVRMLIIRDEWGLKFSDNVQRYIVNWILESKQPVEELWIAQKKHYRDNIRLSKKNLFEIVENSIVSS